MFEHAVHPGIAHDAHQMEPRARPGFNPLDRCAPNRIGDESLLGKQLVQPHEFLVHDAAGTDVLVPDFAVAHHPFGQTDIGARGLDQGVRVLGMQPVVAGLLRQKDRVGLILRRIGTFAPTITDHEEDRLARSAHKRNRRLLAGPASQSKDKTGKAGCRRRRVGSELSALRRTAN